MRARTITSIAVVGGLVAVVGVQAVAHHAFSPEFGDTLIKLTGTVVRMEWINPHTWIHIEVVQPDGSAELWMIEGASPNELRQRGLTVRLFLPGTMVCVEGFQARDGSHKANGRDVTFADGSKVFLGSSGTGDPPDGRDPTEPPR